VELLADLLKASSMTVAKGYREADLREVRLTPQESAR
jgi:hypothetical protein